MPDLAETTDLEPTEVEVAPTDEAAPDDAIAVDVDPQVDDAVVEEVAEEVAVEAPVVDSDLETPDLADVDAPEVAETVEVAEEVAVEAEGDVDVEDVVEGADDEESESAKPTSPYDLQGDWYVIHSYSGYENKVKANLETRIQSMHMEDRIFEVHIPMEDVVEFKAGKKVTVPRKVFPGYILVRMSLDDDSWYAVRNTPGVTGFVAGNAQKPTPLSRREVERFLGVQEEEEKTKPRFKPEWEVGEQVRVVTGPFADFNGVIEDMNVDQQKVTVLVNIFGRDTPVELGFEDIQKN
jgi:transcriptional antiterminator NusG